MILSPTTESAIKSMADNLDSGASFELPVDTSTSKGTLNGRFSYMFLQPADQDLYFAPGQSGAPAAAKAAMTDALQKFLLAAQEDQQAGGQARNATHVGETYSTSTRFQGENSAYSFSDTFSLPK